MSNVISFLGTKLVFHTDALIAAAREKNEFFHRNGCIEYIDNARPKEGLKRQYFQFILSKDHDFLLPNKDLSDADRMELKNQFSRLFDLLNCVEAIPNATLVTIRFIFDDTRTVPTFSVSTYKSDNGRYNYQLMIERNYKFTPNKNQTKPAHANQRVQHQQAPKQATVIPANDDNRGNTGSPVYQDLGSDTPANPATEEHLSQLQEHFGNK